MEAENRPNYLEIGMQSAAALGLLWIASNLPFSKYTKKEIGRRDDWTCQADDCDRSFRDGWMVDAAHNPDKHHKSHPEYDHPESGDIRCVDHHQQQHEQGTSLRPHQDRWAADQLSKRDRRTRWWRREVGNE